MNQPGLGGTSSISFSTSTPGNGCPQADLTEVDKDNLRFELAKMEEEIQTLRELVFAKEKYAADIRRQLGMGPLSNLKQNLSKGWQEVQTSYPYLTASSTMDDISNSNAYVRTKEGLSHAGHVTSSALSNMGVVITRRLAEMRALPLPSPPRTLSHTMSVPSMRQSSTFKSFEEMVGSMKDKITNNGETSGFERRTARYNS